MHFFNISSEKSFLVLNVGLLPGSPMVCEFTVAKPQIILRKLTQESTFVRLLKIIMVMLLDVGSVEISTLVHNGYYAFDPFQEELLF